MLGGVIHIILNRVVSSTWARVPCALTAEPISVGDNIALSRCIIDTVAIPVAAILEGVVHLVRTLVTVWMYTESRSVRNSSKWKGKLTAKPVSDFMNKRCSQVSFRLTEWQSISSDVYPVKDAEVGCRSVGVRKIERLKSS